MNQINHILNLPIYKPRVQKLNPMDEEDVGDIAEKKPVNEHILKALTDELDLTKSNLSELGKFCDKFCTELENRESNLNEIKYRLDLLYRNTSTLAEILQINLNTINIENQLKPTAIKLNESYKDKIKDTLTYMANVMKFTATVNKEQQEPYSLIDLNCRYYFQDLQNINTMLQEKNGHIKYEKSSKKIQASDYQKDTKDIEKKATNLPEAFLGSIPKRHPLKSNPITEQPLQVSVVASEIKKNPVIKQNSPEVPKNKSCEILKSSMIVLQNAIKQKEIMHITECDSSRISSNIDLLERWIVSENADLPQQKLIQDTITKLETVYKRLHFTFTDIAKQEVFDENAIKGIIFNTMLLFCPPNLHTLSEQAITEKTLKSTHDFILSKAFNLTRPLHDLFLLEIPSVRSPKIWKNLINKIGITAIKATQYDSDTNFQNISDKLTKEDLEKKMGLCVYKDPDIVPALQSIQRICQSFNVPPKQFTAMIKLEKKLKISRKKEDLLPNKVIFDVTTGLLLVKLPADSRLALILGNIVKCCQHILGDSEQCVIDGLTLPRNGFYVIIKPNKKILDALQSLNKEKPEKVTDFLNNADFERMICDGQCDIIAQFYGWLSKLGNFVADSIEADPRYTNNSGKNMITAIMTQFANELVKTPDIGSVMVGIGGGTQSAFDSRKLLQTHDKMAEGYMYGDAVTQFILAQNDTIKLQITECEIEYPNLISEQQLKDFIEMRKEYDQNLSRKINRKTFLSTIAQYPDIKIDIWKMILTVDDINLLSNPRCFTEKFIEKFLTVRPMYDEMHHTNITRERFIEFIVRYPTISIELWKEMLTLDSILLFHDYSFCTPGLLDSDQDNLQHNIFRYKIITSNSLVLGGISPETIFEKFDLNQLRQLFSTSLVKYYNTMGLTVQDILNTGDKLELILTAFTLPVVGPYIARKKVPLGRLCTLTPELIEYISNLKIFSLLDEKHEYHPRSILKRIGLLD